MKIGEKEKSATDKIAVMRNLLTTYIMKLIPKSTGCGLNGLSLEASLEDGTYFPSNRWTLVWGIPVTWSDPPCWNLGHSTGFLITLKSFNYQRNLNKSSEISKDIWDHEPIKDNEYKEPNKKINNIAEEIIKVIQDPRTITESKRNGTKTNISTLEKKTKK